ncbi:MAG TPA: hypothetical protein VGI61_09390, partial [Parafilimonas sp.]
AANNYNDSATVNDGSCTYVQASITPKLKYNLNDTINETSGLLWWNKLIWTHNDSGGQPQLYGLDSSTGNIVRTVTITNAGNIDWEDIAQDGQYIYIGDFGNNANGNRTNLKIYRVKKSGIKIKDSVAASVIHFSYSDQTDFTPTGSNNTNFDCEAMIAYNDSLFLFSKDWKDGKTRLYKLPKVPGTYIAEKTSELNVDGLITGAEIISDKRVIVLTGYSNTVTPFIYLLYDFSGNNFFGANKRKIQINESFTQVEGICALNNNNFYISNERFQKFVTVPAKLQTINLNTLLKPYYSKISKNIIPAYAFINRF